MSDRTRPGPEIAIRALAPHLFVGSARQQADLRRRQLAIVMPDRHKKENASSAPPTLTRRSFPRRRRQPSRARSPLGSHHLQNISSPVEKDVYSGWLAKFEALAMKFDEANQLLAALPPEVQAKAKLAIRTQLEGALNGLNDLGDLLKSLPRCSDD